MIYQLNIVCFPSVMFVYQRVKPTIPYGFHQFHRQADQGCSPGDEFCDRDLSLRQLRVKLKAMQEEEVRNQKTLGGTLW